MKPHTRLPARMLLSLVFIAVGLEGCINVGSTVRPKAEGGTILTYPFSTAADVYAGLDLSIQRCTLNGEGKVKSMVSSPVGPVVYIKGDNGCDGYVTVASLSEAKR